MAAIKEGIRLTTGERLSFGDYTARDKVKAAVVSGGDEYRVKTHKDVTKLEKNGKLLLETVPGASIHDFHEEAAKITFGAEGFTDTQFTLDLSPETEYRVTVGGVVSGAMKTNVGGKLIFGAELSSDGTDIAVELCG